MFTWIGSFYLVNFGPNFVGLFLLSGDDLGKTNYVGFISA